MAVSNLVMIYLARLADRLGIDPLQADHEKMLINEEKYPVVKASDQKGEPCHYHVENLKNY